MKALSAASRRSPLEVILGEALLASGISYRTQVRVIDHYVGWIHQTAKARITDAVRDERIRAAGYRIFRFAGKQINTDPLGCVRAVMEACGLVPEFPARAEVRLGQIGEANTNWGGGRRWFTCSQCGTAFIEPRGRGDRRYEKTFCNQSCYAAWLREHPEASSVHTRWAGHPKPTVVCEQCGKEFRVKPFTLTRPGRTTRFCSIECRRTGGWKRASR